MKKSQFIYIVGFIIKNQGFLRAINLRSQYMFQKVSLSLLLMTSSAFAGEYEVTIKNLTTGQPLTPPVVVVHTPQIKIAELGQKAGEGLAELATDGKTEKLSKELNYRKGVVRHKVGAGVILPGEEQTITIEANNPNFKLSILSMLARTNDALAIVSNASLKLRQKYSKNYFATVYDAGVELNSESCEHIPAPPCGNPEKGITEESFIRPHAGIQNIGGLDALRDSFGNIVAKITIKKIH